MKISVIGMGAVGTEIVGSLATMPEVAEIVCLNRTRDKAEGEVLDLAHTTAFTYARNPVLRAGDPPDLAGSDVVVVTAGVRFLPGRPRDDLLEANAAIACGWMREIERHAPGAIVLVATNPVEPVTQLMLGCASLPPERVISLGTVVDTARLMRIISDRVGIDPKNIFGYVLGDHSETAFIPWSICSVCGMDLDTYCRLNAQAPFDREAVRAAVMDAGLAIMTRKGNTNRGISASACRVVRAIIADEKSVLPVGTLMRGEYGLRDVVLCLPCVIGRSGVERVLRYEFTTGEMEELKASAAHVHYLI